MEKREIDISHVKSMKTDFHANQRGWSVPYVLLLCIAIGTIIVGYFFGIWWLLGLFAGYLAIAIISIVVRSREKNGAEP